MPELPEVESSRRFLEQFCCGHTINEVNIYEQGGGPRNNLFDDIIFESKEDMYLYNSDDINLIIDTKSKNKKIEDIYKDHLYKKKLKSINRKGKQLWFQLDGKNSICILFHFGMTGSFVIKDHQIPTYKSFKIDNQWPPRFCKLLLKFSNDIEISFCDPRRLGRIKLRYEPLLKSPIKDLACDPIVDIIPAINILKSQMNSYSAPIKSILLDQEKLFCGIGNYLADEICYQSNIHPSTKTNMINELGIRKLIVSMNSILMIAINSCANYDLFPTHWLFHYRWDKNKSKNQIIKLPNGNQVIFENIAGRTTAIVPKEQPKNNEYIDHQYKEVKKIMNNITIDNKNNHLSVHNILSISSNEMINNKGSKRKNMETSIIDQQTTKIIKKKIPKNIQTSSSSITSVIDTKRITRAHSMKK